MKIFVKVKPNSKIEKVKKVDSNHFEVWVKEVPIEGKANQRLIEIMSEYFGIPKKNIVILSGQNSKNKILKVE